MTGLKIKSMKRPVQMKEDMDVEQYLPSWFSIAPMMGWTNNHYRTIARIMTKHAWLYTEMIAAETIVYQEDNLDRFLAFSPDQHPIVLQIGGSNLDNLAKATKLANAYGYDEINLNCGCPSAKVAGHGCFGASLMLNPKFVAEAMSVIAANCDVPVSVKCRIGVDNRDSYNELCNFIHTVSSQSPTRHFIIHSRKALLNGISPADNRRVPPLKYEYFFALLRDFPDLRFTINGGINCIDEVHAARKHGAHGVMIGRATYTNSWATLGNVDSAIYGVPGVGVSRRQILEQYQVYADSVLEKGGRNKPSLRELAKPLLHLFYASPGNAPWKRKADAALLHCKTMKSLLDETLDVIPTYILDALPADYQCSDKDAFADVDQLLPPPYKTREEELKGIPPKKKSSKSLKQKNSGTKVAKDHSYMASITMAASFLGGLSPSTQQLSKTTRGGLVMVKASGGGASEKQAVNLNCKTDTKKEGSNGRRDLMYSVAAAAAVMACSSIAGGGAAFADEPKNGTAEAKKKYAPVCVTMPTARICRN